MLELPSSLSHFRLELRQKISEAARIMEVSKGDEILRTGQYVKVIPLVLEGTLKVITHHDDRELLLYYIQANESCVMSFTASLHNSPSKIAAVAEENSKVLIIPSDQVVQWTVQYPEINALFYKQYSLRYGDLLHTIDQILFHKLDERLWNYLEQKKTILKMDILKISHKEIANDLGTAREVISRVMKKLENEGKVKQHHHSIEIL